MTINPVLFYFILWSLCLFLIKISPIQFNDLSNEFYSVLVVSFISFTLGYLLYLIVLRKQQAASTLTKRYFVKKKKLVLFQLTAIGVLIIITLLNVYMMTGSFFDFSQYRFMLTEVGIKTFINKITPFFMPVVFVGVPILLHIKASKRNVVLFAILSLIYFIISGSRSIFMVTILVLVWYMYLSRKLKVYHVLIGFITVVFGFSLLGFLLGKVSLNPVFLEHFFHYIDGDVPRNFFTLSILTILKYMLGGIVAFSELTKMYVPSYDFNFTLLNLSKFSSVVGFTPSLTTLSYVEVPFRTNVYTWFYSSYLDFGYYGIIITFTTMGFLGSFLYSNYKRNIIYMIYLSVFYTILTLSIFHDYWYSSLFPYSVAFYLYVIKKSCYIPIVNRNIS